MIGTSSSSCLREWTRGACQSCCFHICFSTYESNVSQPSWPWWFDRGTALSCRRLAGNATQTESISEDIALGNWAFLSYLTICPNFLLLICLAGLGLCLQHDHLIASSDHDCCHTGPAVVRFRHFYNYASKMLSQLIHPMSRAEKIKPKYTFFFKYSVMRLKSVTQGAKLTLLSFAFLHNDLAKKSQIVNMTVYMMLMFVTN